MPFLTLEDAEDVLGGFEDEEGGRYIRSLLDTKALYGSWCCSRTNFHHPGATAFFHACEACEEDFLNDGAGRFASGDAGAGAGAGAAAGAGEPLRLPASRGLADPTRCAIAGAGAGAPPVSGALNGRGGRRG